MINVYRDKAKNISKVEIESRVIEPLEELYITQKDRYEKATAYMENQKISQESKRKYLSAYLQIINDLSFIQKLLGISEIKED